MYVSLRFNTVSAGITCNVRQFNTGWQPDSLQSMIHYIRMCCRKCNMYILSVCISALGIRSVNAWLAYSPDTPSRRIEILIDAVAALLYLETLPSLSHEQRCVLQVLITMLGQISGCIVRIRKTFLNPGKCLALCFPLSLWRQEFLLFTRWRPHWIFACRTHGTLDCHPDFSICSTQLQDWDLIKETPSKPWIENRWKLKQGCFIV